MKPQLAQDADLGKMLLPNWAQPKIDGVRALNMTGTLTGRSLDPFKGFGITEFFSRPEFIGFDGEMTLGDDPTAPRLCSLTTGAMGKFKGVSERADLHWWLFDYVTPETVKLPYVDRYDRLDEMYRHHLRGAFSFLHVVPYEVVYERQRVDAIIGEHLDAGYEGTIWRNPKAAAKLGRSDKHQQLWRSKPWSTMEILVTELIEGNMNTNEAKTNSLGRTERSSAKEGLVPNGQIGSVKGKVVEDFKDPFSDRILFPAGLVVEAGSGEMTVEEATAWFKDPTQIVGHLATIKHLAYGVKDLPRMGTFVSKRLPQDMSS